MGEQVKDDKGSSRLSESMLTGLTMRRYSLLTAIIILTAFLGYRYLYVKDNEWVVIEAKEQKVKALGWTRFSDMKVLPQLEREMPWSFGGVFSRRKVSKGILLIETTGKNIGNYYILDDRLNNATGTTVGIGIKLLKGPKEPKHHDAAVLAIQDGKREGKIAFFKDKIVVYDQSTPLKEYPLNTRAFHDYQMIIFKDTIKVYVDEKEVVSATLSSNVEGQWKWVFYGDFLTRRYRNIKAEIAYVCYRLEGVSSHEGHR